MSLRLTVCPVEGAVDQLPSVSPTEISTEPWTFLSNSHFAVGMSIDFHHTAGGIQGVLRREGAEGAERAKGAKGAKGPSSEC